ncbi:MAG TPA: TetR/AcrR family transcriptional regulator [Ignavibacteriaceae bacterium]|jgi:AcrR family transcriptional regulator
MAKTNKIKVNPEINSERTKILNYASGKFMREGFYKSSMDSLAAELQMSKKTIYKYFPAKDELVEAVANTFMKETGDKISSVIQLEDDSISKALQLFNILGNATTRLGDNWVRDIRIHMPELWKKVDEFRTKKAYAVLGNIILQGQKEGMIIDKPAELIIQLFVSSLRSIVNPDFLYFQKMNFNDAIQHTFEILFNGILSPAGKKLFKKSFYKVLA